MTQQLSSGCKRGAEHREETGRGKSSTFRSPQPSWSCKVCKIVKYKVVKFKILRPQRDFFMKKIQSKYVILWTEICFSEFNEWVVEEFNSTTPLIIRTCFYLVKPWCSVRLRQESCYVPRPLDHMSPHPQCQIIEMNLQITAEVS